jgi:dual specificity tyrosine-phosphorylation-regulated kinase 2/3/4
MAAIMEVIDVPPRSLIAKASRRKVFFDDDYNPIIKPNSRGKLRKPATKPLDVLLKINDPDLIEFLQVRLALILIIIGVL